MCDLSVISDQFLLSFVFVTSLVFFCCRIEREMNFLLIWPGSQKLKSEKYFTLLPSFVYFYLCWYHVSSNVLSLLITSLLWRNIGLVFIWYYTRIHWFCTGSGYLYDMEARQFGTNQQKICIMVHTACSSMLYKWYYNTLLLHFSLHFEWPDSCLPVLTWFVV